MGDRFFVFGSNCVVDRSCWGEVARIKKKKKKKKPVDLAKGTKHLWSATGIKQQLDTIPLFEVAYALSPKGYLGLSSASNPQEEVNLTRTSGF